MEPQDLSNTEMIKVVSVPPDLMGTAHVPIELEFKNLKGQVCTSRGVVSKFFAKGDAVRVVEKALEYGYRMIRVNYGEGYPPHQKLDLRKVIGDWLEDTFEMSEEDSDEDWKEWENIQDKISNSLVL